MRRPRVPACALLALLLAGEAVAGALEKLVMPGPVAAAHAKIESDCASCHEPFHAEAQRGLCLDCHDAVAADLRAGSGFHGRHASAARADCRSCHGEHRGRDGDLLHLDRAAFDHAATDFPLKERHALVACEGCHAQGKPFREAPTACADCHADADVHRGALGADCASCHSERGFGGARFDHAKTRFALDGRHGEVRCELCHADARYAGTPTDCGSCHALNDAHRGRFGARCGDCHAPSGWQHAAFDHARDARFPLTGKHEKAACEACHTGGFDRAIGRDCVACHRADDLHEGRNGAACQECHGAGAWTPARFDHGARTEFPLEGRHAGLACASCHTGPMHEQRLARSCAGCHRDDDAHRGQQGDACERCHDAAGWREHVRFDHDLARFPLLGMHAVAPCEACHASAAQKGTETACVACHRADDAHHGGLGARCETCHNPNAWTAWRFDHGAQTRFALQGAHAELACTSCHPATAGAARPGPARSCAACHREDDPHGGDLGEDCGRCHGSSAWREVSVR